MVETSAKAVFITGCSTGIGYESALYLDRMGYHVFAGVRREQDAQALRKAASAHLFPIIMDVKDKSAIAGAAALVAAKAGAKGLYAIINNAGVVMSAPIEFVSTEDLLAPLEVNLMACIHVIQALLPLLRQGCGRVINITSIGGRQSVPFMGPYCASKAAMEAISDSMRMELRQFGIPVVIVCPGNIKTSIWGKTVNSTGAQLTKLLPQAVALYHKSIQALIKTETRMGRSGSPPILVARTLERILAAKKPKSRYIVGLDAKMQVLMTRFLPDGMRDWIIRLFTGNIFTFKKGVR